MGDIFVAEAAPARAVVGSPISSFDISMSPKLGVSPEDLDMGENKSEPIHKKLPSSPTFFAFENSFTSASAYKPRVWTGSDDPGAGLLGFQAPAADGLDETFSISPASTPDNSLSPICLGFPEDEVPKSRPTLLPRLPPEIHLQILTSILATDEGSNFCSFCHLFQMSSLSTVSHLYHSILQQLIYTNINLSCTISSCKEHHRLSSKHQQLAQRVPLLLRTLESNPSLAAYVKTVQLPSSGMGSYLTCALEKSHLPGLINIIPNLEAIYGLEDLLQRQFFSGEHYCLDGVEPQQHGLLALSLHRKSSLKTWRWSTGNTAGSDFWRRVWDLHPEMQHTDFIDLHSNWPSLDTFVMHDVWGLSAESLQRLFSAFPKLRHVDISGIRKKRVGHGDRLLMLSALSALPESVDDLTVSDVEDQRFVGDVANWVRARYAKHSKPLRRLAVGRVPITAEILQHFFGTLSTPASYESTNSSKYWLSLLDPPLQWRSSVRRLELNNHGFEEQFWPVDADERFIAVGKMELRGLEELKWGVRCSPDGVCGVNFLGAKAVLGWFKDLRMLVLDKRDEEVETIVRRRGIELVIENESCKSGR